MKRPFVSKTCTVPSHVTLKSFLKQLWGRWGNSHIKFKLDLTRRRMQKKHMGKSKIAFALNLHEAPFPHLLHPSWRTPNTITWRCQMHHNTKKKRCGQQKKRKKRVNALPWHDGWVMMRGAIFSSGRRWWRWWWWCGGGGGDGREQRDGGGAASKKGGGRVGGAGGDASLTTMPCCVRLWRRLVNRGGEETDSLRLFAPCTYSHFHRVRLLSMAQVAL